ncbi:MAG: hypothetical protein IJC46_06910 [Clostridia bacterium]|nr:hypothetical protein [Clostridia bacterium]
MFLGLLVVLLTAAPEVGAIIMVIGLGMVLIAIPAEWKAPFNDTLYTSIFGTTVVKISACAAKTMEHIL